MRALRDTIGDYLFSLKVMDRRGRKAEIRKMFIRGIVVAILICTPWIVMFVRQHLARHLYEVNVQGIDDNERWQRLRDGLDILICEDDAGDELVKHGYTLGTPEGVKYAVTNGLCSFEINEGRTPASLHFLYQ